MIGNEEVKWEIRGYVVPYDLPSENVFFLRPREKESEEEGDKREKMRDYVRAKRVQATGYLHRLGVLATNSVILVPTSRIELIDKTIERVQGIYEGVNEKLEANGFLRVGMPVIRKIPIVYTQLVSFRELAERQLRRKLDKKIDDLALLIQKLYEGVEEGKVKRVRYGLNKAQRELESLEEIAKELGISVDNQFALLGEMIKQAINILEVM